MTQENLKNMAEGNNTPESIVPVKKSLSEIAEERKKKIWGGKIGEEGVDKKGESFVYQPTLKQKVGEFVWENG